jgi:phosphonoacetaldehyde hydrolase
VIQAVIFDWAGTMADYGSRAPTEVMKVVFREIGVEITDSEARQAMGLPKKEHIRQIASIPRIAAALSTSPDIDAIYESFIPKQTAVLANYAGVIPGVIEVVEALRARGIKLGSSTGYTRPMLDLLVAETAKQGLRVDAAYCPDDTGEGRPAPWMCFANMKALGVYPPSRCVKVGDTPSDIDEGRNAGMWTVGVVDTGNEEGDPARLKAAGADFLIPAVANLPPVLDEIEARLRAHAGH